MKFGSVCSGIEAASVAWEPLGWSPAWFSEIEPFPCAVLAHHYPDVPNHGDMTNLPERILAGEVEAPDILCGGTPCQAFSVAGRRRSLEDERGNLSLIFCKVADAIDATRTIRHERATLIFWENVPGVLSTKDNAFGCFLAELVGADAPLSSGSGRWPSAGYVAGPKRKAAWRVLDAQYFGIPQRRRRVFVVASARDDIDPAKILFERAGVRGDSEAGGKSRKDIRAMSRRSEIQGNREQLGRASRALDRKEDRRTMQRSWLMKMTIKADGIKAITKQLEKDAKAAKKVLTATGNDMKRRVPGKVADDVRTTYNIKKSDIMPSKKNGTRKAGRISVKGDTVSAVSIVYTGHTLSVARFGMTPKSPNSKGVKVKKRRPIRAQIKKGSKKVVSVRAFLGNTGTSSQDKTQYIAFMRKGKQPYPIVPVKTLSVPQMVSNERVMAMVEKDVNKMLEERLKHNLSRFMKK